MESNRQLTEVGGRLHGSQSLLEISEGIDLIHNGLHGTKCNSPVHFDEIQFRAQTGNWG